MKKELPHVTLIGVETRKKYLLTEFQDKEFVIQFNQTIKLENKNKMMQRFESITNYVLKKMGGFEIDGWKVRSGLSSKRVTAKK